MGTKDDEYDYLFKGIHMLDHCSAFCWEGTVKTGLKFLTVVIRFHSCSHRRLWCWQVKSSLSVHKKRVQFRVEVHHRSRICYQKYSS